MQAFFCLIYRFYSSKNINLKDNYKIFTVSFNKIIIGYASRLLIDTTHTIAVVSYQTGFSILSYFNRIFKARNYAKPKKIKENYSLTKTFI